MNAPIRYAEFALLAVSFEVQWKIWNF